MNKTIVLMPLLLAFTLYPLFSQSTYYFFSTTDGNDNRSFQEATNPNTPLQSINKVNELVPQLKPGDCILFKRGDTFEGSIYVSNSQGGSEGNPILFGAYGNGRDPEISGFKRLTQWQSVGDGIYESESFSTDDPVRMVTIDGVDYAMGRYPNASANERGYLNVDDESYNYVVNNNFSGGSGWEGAELVYRGQRWIFERVTILDQSGNTFYFNGDESSYNPRSGYGFFIQNHYNTLDEYGEWYFNPDNNKLYVYLGDQSPDQKVIKASAYNNLFDINSDYIVFSNLHITGANQFGFHSSSSPDHINIQNCTVSFSGSDALSITRGNDLTIEKCRLIHSNNNAISIDNVTNATINRNYIGYTGMHPGMGWSSDGNYLAIYNRANGLQVTHNNIIHTGYLAISFFSDNSLIKK